MTRKSLQDTIWKDGLPHLMAKDLSRDRSAGILQNWLKRYDHNDIRYAVTRSIHVDAEWPVAFIEAILKRLEKERPQSIDKLPLDKLLNKIKHMEKFCATRPVSNHAHSMLNDMKREWRRRQEAGAQAEAAE